MVAKQQPAQYEPMVLMKTACEFGHVDIAEWCVEYHPRLKFNFENVLAWACTGCQLHVAKWAVEHGASNLQRALDVMGTYRYSDIAKWLTSALEKQTRWVSMVSKYKNALGI